MLKFLKIAVLVSIAVLDQSANAASVSYPNMPVACLPDRAQKDQMAACHCPPVEMCGEMPDFLKQQCGCKIPEAGLCPGAYENSPEELAQCPDASQTRDVNGRCCAESQKQSLRFKSWHVRWREGGLATIRLLGSGPNSIHVFMRGGLKDVNWNRKWLPAFFNNNWSSASGNPQPIDVTTGLEVGGYNCLNFQGGLSLYNCGDLAVKICPQDDKPTYTATLEPVSTTTTVTSFVKGKKVTTVTVKQDMREIIYGNGSQVCSIKNLDGSNVTRLISTYSPDSYKFSKCCVYEIPTEPSCVAPDTLVLMADGSEKMIQKIVKGDVVKGETSDNVVQEVVILTLDNRDMYSLNDGVLKLTAEHPIMTAEGWKSVNGDAEKAKLKYNLDSVGVLKLGDEIITKDGKLKLEKMEKLPLEENTTTFNLKLDGDETFYAGGVLLKDN